LNLSVRGVPRGVLEQWHRSSPESRLRTSSGVSRQIAVAAGACRRCQYPDPPAA
jgi:hypothetical protein